MGQSILLVEDDAGIRFAVKKYFQNKGFTVYTAGTEAEARAYLERQLPSLAIIDWNLPDGDGNTLCKWIRSIWRELPLIFLTVRADTGDMVEGFSAGADDYIVKPFEFEVLYSRIHAILRRTGNGGQTEKYLTCGGIRIDREQIKVFCEEREISLSATEYELLRMLMENKNRTLTRSRLLELIWDANGNFVNDNTLTVTMKRLREKLHNPSCLKTVRSFGYRMEDEI